MKNYFKPFLLLVLVLLLKKNSQKFSKESLV